MAYKALYRIYRPQKFDEVVGQKHILQTLKNAIKENKIAHAYLFSGPRGTGKTSMAKLLAKALNCECDDDKSIFHPPTIFILLPSSQIAPRAGNRGRQRVARISPRNPQA